jgi:Right handed beta helix region
MIHLSPGLSFPMRTGMRRCMRAVALSLVLLSLSFHNSLAQKSPSVTAHSFFIDCSAPEAGDGSLAHPWNTLAAAEAHPFAPGDRIALKRGTHCLGSFAPQGSGVADHIIRLTAYGVGPRPKIVAPSTARQAFLLFNQEYWQVDSLNISGGNTFGVFVTGDKGILRRLWLENLYVHDVCGGAFKNKDNGLVVVGPSSINVFFDDVLIDGVDAAHTNQWAGILVGGGSFPYKDGAPLNTNVQIRNSTVHDVYGDGIVLFRDADSSIRSSAAWETGMQPTQDVGTPNAIWTWTCRRCTVADSEAFLTDSPGVDGGAYDIDWNDQQNTVENNYAHDTQGYCIAVFGAGYVTSDSLVSGNLCIDNALSPRMAASEGAIDLSTWNGGTIRGLKIEGNTIRWNPRVPGAPAIVAPADVGEMPIVFMNNTVESTWPLIYRIKSPWRSSGNTYILDRAPVFLIGDKQGLSLAALQSAGYEQSSRVMPPAKSNFVPALRIDAVIDPALESDGLLAPDVREQLVVLRSLAGQYTPRRLHIAIHLPSASPSEAETNALRDMNDIYPGVLKFARDASVDLKGVDIRLLGPDGQLLGEWNHFINPATLGDAVRERLGPPDYAYWQNPEPAEDPQ